MAKAYLRVSSYEVETHDDDENIKPPSHSVVKVALQCLALFCAAIIGFVIRDLSCSDCKLLRLSGQAVPQGITESTYTKVFMW